MSSSTLYLPCTPAPGLDETSLYLSINPPSLPVCCLRGFCQKLDPFIGWQMCLQGQLRALPLAFQGSWVCPAELSPHPCPQSRRDFQTEHTRGPASRSSAGAVPGGGGSPLAPSLPGPRPGMGCPVHIWGES